MFPGFVQATPPPTEVPVEVEDEAEVEDVDVREGREIIV
jgi:hypothetical protein